MAKEGFKIDKEIEYLEDIKVGLEGRATKYENKAQYLQFNDKYLQEAKRYWKLAELNRKTAKEIDAQISFIRNENNEVEKLILHQSGREIPAKKIL